MLRNFEKKYLTVEEVEIHWESFINERWLFMYIDKEYTQENNDPASKVQN